MAAVDALSRPPPDAIVRTALGHRAADALLVAIELALFDELERGPRSVGQLRRALGLAGPALRDLLDALVALEVLHREGDSDDAVYLNSRDAATWLARHAAGSIGAALCEAAGAMPVRRSSLRDAVRHDAATTRASASAGFHVHAFESFAERVAFPASAKVVCLGVGSEQLVATLRRWHPALAVAAGDAGGALPRADALVLTGVLGASAPARKRALIGAAHAALPPGGRLIAIEALIDDQRRHNAHALLASLETAIDAGGGGGFSGADFAAWCGAAGFERVETVELCATCAAAVAHRGARR